MNTSEEVRQTVTDAYTRAVTSPGGGCCGGDATGVVPKGVAAKLAGYSGAELASLPTEAVANSFGCGNPLAMSGVGAGDVVLDLGSGAGIDLLLAARRVGPGGRVIGVDMTDAMIERARAAAAEAGLDNVEVKKGLIEELPVADASVDWVISNCVINLSPEKERVFAEIARVLKPGGRLSISDIVVDGGVPQWARGDAALYCACIAGAISEAEYAAGLEKAGLTGVAVVDRLLYEGEQLAALVESELAPEAAGDLATLVARLAPAFAGKVASVRFTASKPA